MGVPDFGRGPRFRAVGRGTSGRAGKTRAVVMIEPLEGRALLTGVVTPVTSLAPPASVGPMTVARDANLWLAEEGRPGGPALLKVGASGAKTEVVLPAADAGYHVTSVVAGADGGVWYVLAADNPTKLAPRGKVGHVAADASITEYPLADAKDVPAGAVAAPYGGVYVAVSGGPSGLAVEQIDTYGKVVKTIQASGIKELSWLTLGPDNNLWFVDGNNIGYLSPNGQIAEFPQQAPANGSKIDLSNAHLTLGPDGNMWFLGLGGVSKITPLSEVTTIPAPAGDLTSLSRANDGNLWVAYMPKANSPLGNAPGAALLKVATDGQTTLIPGRVDASGARVDQMVPGPDASIWLGEAGGKVSRINLAGVATVNLPVIAPVNIGVLKTDANQTVDGRVVSFQPNDPRASLAPYSATIDWGDGTVTPGKVAAAASVRYDVSGTHTYKVPAGSTENVSVTVKAANGASDTIFNLVRVVGPTAGTPWQAFTANTNWTLYPAVIPTPATVPAPVVASNPTPVVASNPTPVVASNPTPVVASNPAPVVASNPAPVVVATRPAQAPNPVAPVPVAPAVKTPAPTPAVHTNPPVVLKAQPIVGKPTPTGASVQSLTWKAMPTRAVANVPGPAIAPTAAPWQAMAPQPWPFLPMNWAGNLPFHFSRPFTHARRKNVHVQRVRFPHRPPHWWMNHFPKPHVRPGRWHHR